MSESVDIDHEVPTTSSHNDEGEPNDNEVPTSSTSADILDNIEKPLSYSLNIDYSATSVDITERIPIVRVERRCTFCTKVCKLKKRV